MVLLLLVDSERLSDLHLLKLIVTMLTDIGDYSNNLYFKSRKPHKSKLESKQIITSALV